MLSTIRAHTSTTGSSSFRTVGSQSASSIAAQIAIRQRRIEGLASASGISQEGSLGQTLSSVSTGAANRCRSLSRSLQRLWALANSRQILRIFEQLTG